MFIIGGLDALTSTCPTPCGLPFVILQYHKKPWRLRKGGQLEYLWRAYYVQCVTHKWIVRSTMYAYALSITRLEGDTTTSLGRVFGPLML